MLNLVAGLPPWFKLENGYTIRVTTQDASLGGVVSSVVISEVSISVDQEDAATVPVDQPLGEIFLLPGPAMVGT